MHDWSVRHQHSRGLKRTYIFNNALILITGSMKEHFASLSRAAKDVGVQESTTDLSETEQTARYVVALYPVASIPLYITAASLASGLLWRKQQSLFVSHLISVS